MKKSSILWKSLLALLLIGGAIVNMGLRGNQAKAAASCPPSQTSLTNLDDNASRWGIYQDGGNVAGKVSNIFSSSLNSRILAASLISGEPYVGLHVYRNLAPAATATCFEMALSFNFTKSTNVQALEFTMNKWSANMRWEWALQWEQVGDGSPEQGNPPTWRLWTGTKWIDTHVQQQLSEGTWHTLHLSGMIVDGNVQYIDFQCDDIATALSQSFSPVPSVGSLLAVGVQLDGNNQEDAYKMYLNGVNLLWS